MGYNNEHYFDKERTNGEPKGEQERLGILTRDFEKLEENWKEYIRELTRQLVDIHCGGELTGINAVIDSVSI